MERNSRCRSKKDSKGRSKSPKVPIKTYRWEDVRRARRKGGYPWTYLYKGPFNEELNTEQFTMDRYRRTKSSSPMSGVEIHEVSTYDSETSQMSTNLSANISEPSEPDLKKMQRESSLIIEELPSEDEQAKVKDSTTTPDEVQPKEEKLTLSKESCVESLGSTDSISEYLDKEERVPPVTNNSKNGDSEHSTKDLETATNVDKERAKSEESSPRKRKLSAESSYSRISLSKLAVMKRLREAKDKIKIPKISFPTKRGTKKKPSPPKETKTDTTLSTAKTQKDTKKFTAKQRNEKPVYIHIPLKPPPEETDEFSNLENSISNDKKVELTKTSDEGTNKNEENSENVKITNVVAKKNKIEATKNLESEKNMESKEDLEVANKKSATATKTEDSDKVLPIEPKNLTKKPPLKINPAFKQFLKEVRQLKEEDYQEIVKDKNSEDAKDKEKNEDKEKTKKEQGSEEDTKPKVVDTLPKKSLCIKLDTNIEPNDANSTDNKETKLQDEKNEDSEMELDLSEQEMEEEDFDKLFQGTKQKKDTIAVPGSSRNVRSRSVEPPQMKRRSSIESSYSRKSLSKLGIMKKLNEAKEKIKSSLSLSNLFRKDSKNKKPQENKNKQKEKGDKDDKVKKEKKPKAGALVELTKKEPPKDVKPVYIHIPLKPPEGKTDEFSYLEFATKEKIIGSSSSTEADQIKHSGTTVPVSEEAPSVGTPDGSTGTNDIHIIFLTPPSDDETLDDKTPDIPETPSSDDVKFFSGKIGELKMLAQHAVNEISPSSKIQHLETVSEESPSDRSSVNDEIVSENKEELTQETEDVVENRISKDITADQEKFKVKEDQIVNKNKEITEDKNKQGEKMLVDEEDGLNEPTNKHDELKSSLKPNETTTSPVMKKKVSFKRKNKFIKDTGDYEEIQAPKEEISSPETETKENNIFLAQSMSVDEEKSYLDQKMIKDTSLEEDYNKWSKKESHSNNNNK